MSNCKSMPTQARLKELLDYNPETGEFRWKLNKGRVKANTRAGTVSGNGYRQIKIDQKFVLEHRAAWVYYYGDAPSKEIDHIDNNRANNAIANLRIATCSQNRCNSKLRSDNTSGVKGVWFCKKRSRWIGEVLKSGKKQTVGQFKSKDDARIAVERRRMELHGQFANNG